MAGNDRKKVNSYLDHLICKKTYLHDHDPLGRFLLCQWHSEEKKKNEVENDVHYSDVLFSVFSVLTNCLLFGTNIMTKVMRQMPIRPKPKQTGAKDSFNTVADNTQANHDGIVTAIKTPMYLDSLE